MNLKGRIAMLGIMGAMMSGGMGYEGGRPMPEELSPEETKKRQENIKRSKGLKEFYPGIWALNQKSADRKFKKQNNENN